MGTALLIKNEKKELVDFPEEHPKEQLNRMYRLLECERLDAVRISPELVIWADDEGLFKPNPQLQGIAYMHNNQVVWANQLAGAVLVTAYDEEGRTLPLTEGQQADVMQNIRMFHPKN